jgi:hypothetical protein
MTYRDVATKQVLTWCFVAVGARAPVAAAPLAVVFLARERPGGYSLAAVLAAAFVIGEIAGAPVRGARLRPDRARPRMAAGLAAGAAGFAGLGALPGAHPVVLAACAFLAGAAPSAVPGGLRALLTSLVPRRATAQALSTESVLTSAIWAVAPAAVTGLALGLAPGAPLLLAAALMAASAAGLWLLPAGWDRPDGDRGGTSVPRLLAGAWPVYVTGAASLSLPALAELVLPALLEWRGTGVGWSGPLPAGMSAGSGVGAFLCGLRTWPGRLHTRGAVLMAAMSACVTLVAQVPAAAGVAAALVAAGMLQGAVMLTRNLALREALPPGDLAAGYSVMYAAVGVGYAATGSLAGALLEVATPSVAILAGVALTPALTVLGWRGEAGRTRRAAVAAPAVTNQIDDMSSDGSSTALPGTGDGLVAGPDVASCAAEGAPIRGGSDAEDVL